MQSALATGLALLLMLPVTVSGNVRLGPAKSEQEPPTEPGIPADAEALGKARDLYSRGEARYETFDYAGAIELWTEAYAKLRESPQSTAVRAALVYNIATARISAYEVDKDLRQLHRARLLLEKYIRDYEQIYGDNFETLQEISKIKSKLDEIDRMLAQVESTGAAEVSQEGPVDLGDLEPPKPDDASGKDGKDRKIGPMGIAGIVTGSLGVAMAGVMVGGLIGGQKKRSQYEQPGADRAELEEQGFLMNNLAIGSGAVAGALIITGVVLLAVDISKRKRSKTARRFDARPGVIELSF